jgi:AbiJ N-terminal domain 3
MKISSEITRRDIVDALSAKNINWNGRLEESEFLSRLFNIESLPSTDPRFKNAAGDIWQHRVNNDDWENNWVFLTHALA